MSQRHLVLQVETNSKQLKPKKSSLQSLSDISQKAVGPNLKQIVNHWDTVKHTQHDSQPLPNESRRGSYTPNVRNKVSSQSQLFRASSTNLKAEKLPKLSNQKVTSIKNIVEKATLGERVSSANWLNERNRRSNDNLNSQYMNEINDGKSWYEMDDPDKVSTAKIWFPEDVKKLKKRPQSGHSSHSGVKLVPLSQNSDLKLNASLALEAIEPIEKKSESSERKTQPLESQQSKTSLSSQDSVSSTRSLVRHKSQILVDLENSNTFEEFAQEYIFDGELNESKNSNLSDSIGFKPSDSQDLVVELAKWNRELKRASIDEIRRASVDVAIKEKITEEDELNNSINRSSAGSSMYDITFDVIRNATLQSEKDIVNTKYQKEIGKKEEILKPIITTEPLKPLIKTESLKSQVGSSRSNLLMSRAGSSSTLKSATTSSAALWKPGGRKGSLIWKPGGSGNEKLAEFLRNRI